MDTTQSDINNFYAKLRNSTTLKLLLIGVIVLLLQLPTMMIEQLNTRRITTGKEAQKEIFSQWGKEQTIGGPILFFWQDKQKDFYLPERLSIKGTVTPELRYRGIFQSVTYSSVLHITGEFNLNDLPVGYLYVPLSDNKGLVEGEFKINGVSINAQVMDDSELPNANGLLIQLPPEAVYNPEFLNESNQNKFQNKSNQNKFLNDGILKFDFQLTVNGSETLNFLPLGRNTAVELTSEWDSPGFIGHFLPQNRTVDPDGFTAEYRINELNRTLPQQWRGSSDKINDESFGVNFYIPSNIYLQTLRAIRYSALVIVFTMLAFFLTERLTKCPMHPVQYLMAGLAVVLFYVLMLSLGEHLPFGAAYFLSAMAVALSIGYYARLIFRRTFPAIVEVLLMLAAYGAIYIMLQMEDFALLTGTVTLFVLLIVLMTFTGNLNRQSAKDQ